MKLAGPFIAVCILCICITTLFELSNAEDTCGGPREDLGTEVDGYIPPGRQVILIDTVHEFTDCGQISQWSMIFSCTASSDGNGYPLELQVFEQSGFGSFRLLSKAQVTLTDEQCERQLVSFNVSLPFCQRNRVGMHMPNLAGLTGLGYRETENRQDTYLDRGLSVPPSVGDRVSSGFTGIKIGAFPLVSVKVTDCGVSSTEPPPPFSSTIPLATTATITTSSASSAPSPSASPTLDLDNNMGTSSSASSAPSPSASPTLDFDNDMGTSSMDGNATVVAVVVAILLVVTVTSMAIAGVFVVLFVCQRRTKAMSGSKFAEASSTTLTVPQQVGIDSVYSEVIYSEVEDNTVSPYELPVTRHRAPPAYEFQDCKGGLQLQIVEDERSLRRASGATINQPALDQEDCYTGWVVPTMDQRRKMKTTTLSSVHIYSQLEPCYAHYSALEGIAAEKKVPPFVCEPHYEFDSSACYWTPGLEEDDIYSQMYHWKYREIPCNLITLSNRLGEGQFGEVFRAKWGIPPNGPVDVAVKLLKKGAPQKERLKLLQEAAILGQFRHRYVVSLLGVVTLGEPKMMVMELLSGGNLQKHLLSIRRNEIQRCSAELPTTLLKFCRQVAEGLSYLAGKSFVHRDIAARNILLDKELNCKISDFGMSRDLDEETYYVTSGGCVPIKWTSPEAILYKKYSTSSDVWSYGMLMYEIWSLGHRPFGDKTVDEVVKMFDQSDHYCQPPPPGCPRVMYAIMVDCWNPDHGARPPAKHIAKELSGPQLKLALSEDTPSALPACTLGAPLEEGRGLYQDLQTKYN